MTASTSDADPGVAARVRRWVRPAVQNAQTYHVPESVGLIKLDAMENPYPWPAPMVQDWLQRLAGVTLNRYPSAGADSLKQSLRKTMQVPDGLELMLGNGSDELIQLLQLALGGNGRCVLAPTPTFVMYKTIAGFCGMDFVEVPLASGFELDAAGMAAAIREHNPALVFIAYPNNPSGNLFDRKALYSVIESSQGLIVIDEAYHAFAQASFLEELMAFENVVVMRTLSKLGLAGLRLGILIGRPEWLREFEKVRLPYNIGTLTQLSAEFALEHSDEFERQAQRIVSERARLAGALADRPGVRVFPSATNFLLFRPGSVSANRVHEELLKQGVLIKNLSQANATLAGCLRVTVGTKEEDDAFLSALDSCLV